MTEQTPLTEAQTACLAAIADAVIPPSEAHRVPGAGDPLIVAGIVNDGKRKMGRIVDALAKLDALADARCGAAYAELAPAEKDSVTEAFREAHADLADMIAGLTVGAYYRDDRVLLSLGMEQRPPHPEGYKVPDGDWSLLEPVQRRDPFYRRTG